jgi:hypothetical protein
VNNVGKWAHSGRLKFNAQKCTSLTRKRNPIVAEYVINGRPLQHVSQQKHLGVTVSSDLTWSYHIHEQITKANRMLGMLKRSTGQIKDVTTRRSIYLALVRSRLRLRVPNMEPTKRQDVWRTGKGSKKGNQIHPRIALQKKHHIQIKTSYFENENSL